MESMKMKEYYFKNNEFVIENFDRQKTFSSFLPGLAGKKGIPLWAFYVNRGQGIASFGIHNKDNQILDFSPAVTAYQQVSSDGFRTFVKVDGTVHEIFGLNNASVSRKMRIKRSEFTIEEVNHDLGLTFEVTYYGLPNENIAALVREVRVTNTAKKAVTFELLDGLAMLLPYQVQNGTFKVMSNLLRSWMEVYSLEHNVGFYRMRSSSTDSAEVKDVTKGNFYVSSINDELIKPIVDNRLVFGYDNAKRFARYFEEHSVEEIYAEEQVTANKIPVGFSGVTLTLASNETTRINTVIGHAHNEEQFLLIKDTISNVAYLDQKRQEAFDEVEDILNEVTTETAFPIFDDYIKQNYMDNLLRGGYPMVLKGEGKNHVYHLYSRKHGDLERDYNYFTIAPEFYSQGNGNFRDVCQNRRSDVLINPEVEDFNMKMFASFIQVDGYNPLSINGSTFEIKDKQIAASLVFELFDDAKVMHDVLQHKFTPGWIINTLANNNITTKLSDEEIFEKIFVHAEQNFEAHFAEGYWIDHWTYILDLVENFESVYPDYMEDKLYHDTSYKFFNSPITVLPRDEKIVIAASGDVRRFGSILHDDEEKKARLHMNPYESRWLEDNHKQEVTTSLFGKLFVLVVNKLSHLDPSGMGIEMEAEKPGWNDAMNGLPGLFGSGVSETIELQRVIRFLQKHIRLDEQVTLPKEFVQFARDLQGICYEKLSDFMHWDKANDVKEQYRNDIRFTTSGMETMSVMEVREMLNVFGEKVASCIEKAYDFGKGIFPTYLVHTATKFVPIMDEGKPHIGHYGLPTARVLEFSVRALPNYLEAPARALKIMDHTKQKKDMYKQIKASNIYDHELQFYKTSEFLDDEKNEIGRGRSFTKGWQERESNFLHMTYKYLVGLLKAGLYDEYYSEIETNLTCFMDPKVYGRSTLENSSFIASSVNPDPEVRGQGYVARLSGSTAEMLSLWQLMMLGKHIFKVVDGQLTLQLTPKLHKSFFNNNKVRFTLFGTTTVTYVNESGINTYDKEFEIKNYNVDGKDVPEIKGDLAHKLRNKEIKEVIIYF